MCSDYRSRVERVSVSDFFSETGIPLRFPEGIPNMEPRDDIRITDRAPIVRAAAGEPDAAEMVQRRWSWPAPNGKPVYNFRSDGREFAGGRCLILTDGFYEFTPNGDPKVKRKHKWLFTLKGEPWFCIAGLWRASAAVGEAFTVLTTAPGADVAPYHDRQIAVLTRDDWARWLDTKVSAKELLRPLPAGSLEVAQVA